MPAVPGHYAEGPEALIVSLAVRGDKLAFAELVRRRQSWIRNLMRRLCGDPALADDLAQQVFLQAWRKLRGLRQPDRFAGWLKRIAINEWMQRARRHDPLRNASEDDQLPPAHEQSPSLAMDLDRALAALAPRARACVVLCYHEGVSHGEIAALTGMQLGTVKSHIRRGSQRLRELLSAYEESR